ncbi:MAG: WG repeat-containing protein [Alphaproteobacteria bacterium]|nr:WG repeat-containing protein [Alphaproteobacteria bacterium]
MNVSKKFLIASGIVSLVLIIAGLAITYYTKKTPEQKQAEFMAERRRWVPLTPPPQSDRLGQGARRAEKNERFAVVGADGKAKTDYRFTAIRPFVNGRAIVMKDGKFGFIDANGREIGKIIYDSVSQFANGRAIVNRGGKAGVIDMNGREIVVPGYFDSISPFTSYGEARAENFTTGTIAILNMDGKIIQRAVRQQ